MFTSNSKPEPDYVDTKKLGQWLSEHSISRSEIAKALGVQTTVVHNWFARQRIPKNVQGSLRHLMSKDYPSELESSISVRLKNSMLNEIARQAVKEGLSLEEWIERIIAERLEKCKILKTIVFLFFHTKKLVSY